MLLAVYCYLAVSVVRECLSCAFAGIGLLARLS